MSTIGDLKRLPTGTIIYFGTTPCFYIKMMNCWAPCDEQGILLCNCYLLAGMSLPCLYLEDWQIAENYNILDFLVTM